MKRIGIAAGKISKGNLFLYYFYVVCIASLFSLFIFIVVGTTVILSLTVMAYVANGMMPVERPHHWDSIRMICMVALTVIIAIFNLLAIFINIRMPGRQE